MAQRIPIRFGIAMSNVGITTKRDRRNNFRSWDRTAMRGGIEVIVGASAAVVAS